jgi:DNA invertase Pin-like site-specific DNA recombinase
MPQSREGHKRPKLDEVNLIVALSIFQNKGLLVRAVAKQFNVSHTTLQRHLENHKRSGNEKFACTNKCAVWTVFSGGGGGEEEEEEEE